jgi:hypothetical protein
MPADLQHFSGRSGMNPRIRGQSVGPIARRCRTADKGAGRVDLAVVGGGLQDFRRPVALQRLSVRVIALAAKGVGLNGGRRSG